MKPTMIPRVLDLAWEARKLGKNFVPLFSGEAGLGKSALCQLWRKVMQKTIPDFGFIDLRIAYYEGPDMVGYPKELMFKIGEEEEWRTINCLPDFWPREGEGLILLEEPNRGTPGVMNTLMQVLTDRMVGHKFKLPEGWMIAACINPEGQEYDVNRMDAALRNRFVEYPIEYDQMCFEDFMSKKGWSENVQLFVSSGQWAYATSDVIANQEGAVYISPRTWERINDAEQAGALNDSSLHRITSKSVLGKDLGEQYWAFCFKAAPVLAKDLLKNEDKALAKLKKMSEGDKYKGDMISVTIDSIVEAYGGLQPKEGQISEDVMCKVAEIIPKDQSVVLIRGCGLKAYNGEITSFFKDFTNRRPDLVQLVRDHIKMQRAQRNQQQGK